MLSVVLPPNSTAADALRVSGLPRQFPDVDFDHLQAGIWGNTVTHDHALLDGDAQLANLTVLRDNRINRASRELRTYGIGAQIIADLGIRKMKVLSAPWKLTGLAGFGLEVVEYVDPLAEN